MAGSEPTREPAGDDGEAALGEGSVDRPIESGTEQPPIRDDEPEQPATPDDIEAVDSSSGQEEDPAAADRPRPADRSSNPVSDLMTDLAGALSPGAAAAGAQAGGGGDDGYDPEADERATQARIARRRQNAEDDPDIESFRELLPSRRLVLIALALLALFFGANFGDVLLTSRQTFAGTAEAAVVLGAAQYNGEPSPALRGRLDRAAELYDTERVEIVVVTGGGQELDDTTEAAAGYTYLRETAGIPDEQLRLEVDGESTYQSLAAAARFLSAEGIDSVILVTDPYHAKRSLLVAEEVGLEAEVSPTDTSSSIGQLAKESLAVGLGRVAGFRRIDAYIAG